MKAFEASLFIHAPAEVIWSVLTDAAKYPAWNTTVDKVEGRIASGEKITVFAKLSPGRAFPVTVTEFAPPHKMVWKGGMPLGLFTGERTFTITPAADGRVEFHMREVFSGLMAPLIEGSLPDMQPAFAEFAAGLKRACEASAPGHGA